MNKSDDFLKFAQHFFKCNYPCLDGYWLMRDIEINHDLKILLEVNLFDFEMKTKNRDESDIFQYFKYLMHYHHMEKVNELMNGDFRLIDFEAFRGFELLKDFLKPTDGVCEICAHDKASWRCLPFLELHHNYPSFFVHEDLTLSDVRLCENCHSNLYRAVQDFETIKKPFIKFDSTGALPF